MNSRNILIGLVIIVVIFVTYLVFVRTGGNGNVTTPSARVGETVTMHGISITLNAVTGDSRCPKGVECIWAGNVSADVTLKHQGESKTITMKNDDAALLFGGSNISLSNIAPEAMQGVTIASGSYILTFTVIPQSQ